WPRSKRPIHRAEVFAAPACNFPTGDAAVHRRFPSGPRWKNSTRARPATMHRPASRSPAYSIARQEPTRRDDPAEYSRSQFLAKILLCERCSIANENAREPLTVHQRAQNAEQKKEE